jgi:dihydroorotate dehydrogenase
MHTYKRLIRPLLFRLDPETAHSLAKVVLRHPHLRSLFVRQGLSVQDERLQVSLGRLRLPNPVGLGAGLDKDCEMVDSLQRFGFGYIVVGSVMCNARPGNPRPRMIRDLEREGLFSCQGLPSKGLDYAVMQLKRCNRRIVPLIINFNAEEFEDYLRCTEELQSLGDALEISLICPNRPANDEGELLDPRRARNLLEEVAKRTAKPVFVKLPGYVSEEERRQRLRLIDVIISCGVEGITVIPKMMVKHEALSMGQGTLTGRPAFGKMLDVVRDVYEMTKGKCHIKAAGGIFSAEDAFEAIAAGATAVEMVTGFAFEGWPIARDINQGLLRLLAASGIENVTALRGAKTNVRPGPQ